MSLTKPEASTRRTPKPLRGSAPARKRRPRRVRKTTLAALKRKLWKLFAAYVLGRDQRICFTCGKPANQAGHFYSRRIASVWVDPKNVHAQCATCNLYLHGNPGAYAEAILNRYGSVELARLTQRANRVRKDWRADEIQLLIDAIRLGSGGEFYESVYFEENL
jgi:hypothetical protein